ncbi:MAG: VRR-NUC domain-containing protein [Alphaproteobacteria bacterium]|nr:VRR-NUC domain-containing protein [Alphaproteobacteria bacterium]
MTVPREAAIVRAILAALNALPRCRAIKLHVSRFGVVGTPDILCVRDGRAVLIEVKRPGGRVTDIQAMQMRSWAGAGATCGVATSVAQALELVSG